MEVLLSRYRTLTVLVIVVVAQLLYLAYQVKTNRDERLIRVWAVSAVTPMAGIFEGFRRNTIGFLEDYFILLDVRDQNRKLKSDNDRLRMDNVYYRNQLSTAEHARALILFQAQSPSKTVPARVIGNSTVATAKAVFIDRGSTSGIEKGMAVVTPEGIVGKVVAVYPLTAQVLLVTDPTFKVGVESQKNHVHGVLACGGGKCAVEQIENQERVDPREWFYTSGEDRIFPKGFPVGSVISADPGQGMKDVRLNLSGAPDAAEEVLVVLQGVHQAIPATPPVIQDLTAKMLPPPPSSVATDAPASKPQTEADKVVHKYQQIGQQEDHVYGAIGSNVPSFNVKPGGGTNPATPSQETAQNASGAATPPTAEKKPDAQAAHTTTAPAPAPATLGTSENPKPAPVKAAAAPETRDTSARPVLPLGAPRHKPATAHYTCPNTAPAAMNETSEQVVLRRPLKQNWFSRFQVVALAALTLIAIIGKFYLPRLLPHTEWLELPLLLTVYFGLMGHTQIASLFFGAFVGLAEDSLSPANLPIGMYGITKTLVGYFAASVSLRFNVENSVIRLVLCFFFFFFHAFFYWIMRRALLGQIVPFDPQETFVHGALNALVAIPLFAILDKMRLAGPH